MTLHLFLYNLDFYMEDRCILFSAMKSHIEVAGKGKIRNADPFLFKILKLCPSWSFYVMFYFFKYYIIPGLHIWCRAFNPTFLLEQVHISLQIIYEKIVKIKFDLPCKTVVLTQHCIDSAQKFQELYISSVCAPCLDCIKCLKGYMLMKFPTTGKLG